MQQKVYIYKIFLIFAELSQGVNSENHKGMGGWTCDRRKRTDRKAKST